MYPLLPIISKVLVPGEGGIGGNQEVRGHDQHKATERSVSGGRAWVGQDAKHQMTYEQFLNQTERGRKKRRRRGLGKKRKGKARDEEEWQPYRRFAFISTSEG